MSITFSSFLFNLGGETPQDIFAHNTYDFAQTERTYSSFTGINLSQHIKKKTMGKLTDNMPWENDFQ